MEEAEGILFIHSHSSRSEGWRYIFLYAVIVVLLVSVIWLFQPNLRFQNPIFYRIVVGLVIFIGVIVVFGVAVPAILRNDEFSFSISPERVSCNSPASEPGGSFTLLLDEILAVEMFSGENRKVGWYILSHDGKRYPIPSQFGNPVDVIVRTLIHLRPELEPRRL
jgi:hypothetical protein